MSNIYVVIMLIGISCVFLGTYVGLKVKINLINARWRNLRKNASEKRRKEYGSKRHLYRHLQKVNVYLLIVSMIVSSMYFMSASVSRLDYVNADSNMTKKMEETYRNPMDRLDQNTEKKVKEMFMDYLFFSWFEEEEGRTKENYREKVDKLFEGSEFVSDVLEKKPVGKKGDVYATYVDRQREIDQAKIPEGATLEQVRQGKALPKQLTVDEYVEEYALWEKRYLLYPIAANLQQMARTAVDVQTTMMKYSEYEDDWDEIIEYAMHGIQFYLALMFYISSGESKADCCYWIAKTFYDLAQKMPAEYAEYVEHCYLMAYAFAEKGLSCKSVNYQMDDHISDIIEIKDKADKALDNMM